MAKRDTQEVVLTMENQQLVVDEMTKSLEAWIFDIQSYSINDGPGIRTTVFFKGCPLRCFWCSNPESQEELPQLLYFESLCIKCYRCIAACPNGAVQIGSDGLLEISRELCKSCGTCVGVCPQEARSISGRKIGVEELLEVVKKDSLFYRNSGGGVTVSGGEPCYQPDFLLQFLKRCYECGLHTVLDTCGYVSWPVLEKILEYVDLVFFDVKHMNPSKHMDLTGVDNKLIIDNARRIAHTGKPLVVRVPLIPGYNDSEENIKALGEFVAGLSVLRVDLLPYHKLGVKKCEALGRIYPLSEVKSFEEEQVQAIQRKLSLHGIEVLIA